MPHHSDAPRTLPHRVRMALLLLALASAGRAAAAGGPYPEPPATEPVAAAPESLATPPDTLAAPPPAPEAPPGPPAPVRFGRHNVAAWPVYFSWDWEGDRALRVFGPVTTTYRSPEERSTFAIWPLTGARAWRDGRRATHVLWPLLYTTSDPARGTWRAHLATPLLGVRSATGPGWSDYSFLPFYHAERDADGRRERMVTPFRRSVRAPLGHAVDDTWGFVPLGTEPLWWLFRRWESDRARGWNSAWLWGGWRTADARTLYLLPWIDHARTERDGSPTRFRALLPLYAGFARRGEGWDAAAPAFWRYRSASFTSTGLWPFWASFTRVRADSTVRRGASIAWPLVTWGRGDDWSTFGLLPLWYAARDGERRFACAPPLWWDVAAPGRRTRVLAPVWASHVAPGDTTRVVLTWFRQRRPGVVHDGLLPFWERRVAADRGELTVPLAWYQSWSPRHESRVAPLLLWGDWRSKVDGSRTRLTGPLLVTSGPGTRGFGVLPVFYTTRGPAARRTLLGPVFTSAAASGERHVAILPLSWWRRDPGGWALDLLPLSGLRSRTDGRRLLYVLGPTFVRRVDSPTRRSASVCGWLWRDETRGERRRTMLQPLWFRERRGADRDYVALLGGLLGSYERQGRDRQLKVAFVPVRRWAK